MYTKIHMLTDIYKVKQDIRHIYNHGGQFLTDTSKRELKQMVFTLEEIEKLVRFKYADGTNNDVSNQVDNGIDSDGSG